MLEAMKMWPEWIQVLVALLGSLSLVATPLSALVGFLGSFWSPAMKIAAWISKAGIECHQAGAKIGSLMGGSPAVPNAAMAPLARANTAAAAAATTLTTIAMVLLLGCTPAQSATAVTVGKDVLNVAQKLCVDLEASLPLFGLPAPTIAEIDVTCNIVGVADTVVQDEMKRGAAAATPIATQVKAKLAAKAAK
jgi:hypothetical protein